MMNPDTVIQRMKLAASAKPSAKYKLILATVDVMASAN